MIKKITATALLLSVLMSISACSSSMNKNANTDNSIHKKAEITVYLPEGQNIDKKYRDDKDIAINYLAKKDGKFSEKEVNAIADNIDKSVKVLILSSDREGSMPVFSKVKSKLPGIITIAGDSEEFDTDSINKIMKDKSLDVGFMSEKKYNAYNSVTIAKQMSAKTFVYLYTNKDKSNSDLYMDIQDAKLYCDKKGIKFVEVEVEADDSSKISEEVKKIASVEGSEGLALYPSDQTLSKEILKLAIENKYIIPNLNSDNDGELIADVMNLKKEYEKLTREEFDELVSKKLSDKGISDKIAAISEGRKSVPAEISIEIAKYMYENNYMIEECYRDVSVVDRGNQKLNLQIKPEYIDSSFGYVRKLKLNPRIY
ncbi:DUF3798 domain-containing protein [Peptostreptococcus faecalis]|uniref:DUF3798 domain-containing protein n=1 Tax=Peptostreptococcus faecalis TaxID=2045015 RepID=UPI000C7A7E09|nr:DUF3798 domain-containing protein [Peptostreptococcus faecalis]